MSKIHRLEPWGKLACGRKISVTINKTDREEFQKILLFQPHKACSQCYWSGWTR